MLGASHSLTIPNSDSKKSLWTLPGILGWGKVRQNNINYEPLPKGREVFPNRDRYEWGKMKSLTVDTGYEQC